MKDKYTFHVMEKLDDSNDLDIDYYDLINDEELKGVDIDIENIKRKTYEKIGISKIQNLKTKKIINLIASISLILLIGTPVTLGFVKQLYKYDKSSGRIIKSDVPLYILKNPITKKVGNGEITINSFVVNPKEKDLTINEVANNIQGYEYYKEDIILNGKNITNSTYEKFKNGWDKHTGTYFDENGSYEFKYIVTLLDKDKKTTKVEFDIELEEATSVEEYNKNLPKSIKSDIVVSAMTKEIDNNLYVELMAIPNVENMNFTVDNYGNYINENKGSNIWLIDANGKKVEGEYTFYDNKNNTFKFDINNLVRPFTLEIEEITVSSDNESKYIKLPKIKFKEIIELNEVINLEDKSNLLTKENHNILLKKMERKNKKGIDTITIECEYIDNKDSNFELKFISIKSYLSKLGMLKSNIGSASVEFKDNNTRLINIELCNLDDKNYKGRKIDKRVGLDVSINTYKVKGPWKINIK